jgi:hypothetical protein
VASAALSRRVEKVVGYPPLLGMDAAQRREFPEALLDPTPRLLLGERLFARAESDCRINRLSRLTLAFRAEGRWLGPPE